MLLNYVELETALLRVAELINRRPLGVRVYSEADFHPICPADLLLGRIYGYKPSIPETPKDDPDQVNMPVRLAKVEGLVDMWWQRWSAVGFPLLCPRRKWTQPHRNLTPGDIVLLKGDQQVGKGVYRLARVMRALPDSNNVVRTVVIGLRKRRGAKREASNKCKVGLEEVPMAVQRLVVVQPATEKWEDDIVCPTN